MSAVKPSLAEDASDDAFALAMMRCQMYAPACSDQRECAMDGWCFGHDGNGFARARQQVVAALKDERNVFTRSWLKLALDALDHHRFLGSRALDAMRAVAINKEVRKQYGWKEPPSR